MKFSTGPILLLALAAACAPRPGSVTPSRSPGTGSGGFDLIVLSTTDVHGRIRGWDYYSDSAESVRGLARAATVVDSIRAANPERVLLVDAGDLLQGNPFAYVARRQFGDSANPIVAAMNAMRYDAAAIGNHEYNYGVPYLERAVRQARFPFLSANTYRPDGKLAFRAWTIVERQGVKIGIVGATTPGVMVWDAENVRGRIRLGEIVSAVRKAVGEVRDAGAKIVIVTMHSGLDEPASYDSAATGLPSENVAGRVAREIPGIHLIVYGHTHREQKNLHIGSTLLMQPKNWATSVGVSRLSIARAGSGWRVAASSGETIQAAGHAEFPAVVAVAEAAHRATVAYANTVIGFTRTAWRGDSARLRDTPLIDLILEVERKVTGADLASTAAFTLDAALDTGAITVAEMARLYPYDNTLRAVRISGRQLRDYLEFSSRYYAGVAAGPAASPTTDPGIPGYNYDIIAGADYALDLTKPVGSRVTSLSVKGKRVAPADSFTLALNNYRQSGGGGFAMIQGAPVVYDKQEEIRDLLIAEVTRRQELKQADYFTQNWSLVYPGAPAVAGAARETLAQGPRLRIISTNDFHGALEPRPDAGGVQRGGAAYVAAMIDRAREECAPACETLLLDGGDMFQGTPASNLAFGRPVVEYYNRMGYAAAALGNHEFDWGVDTLRARMREAKHAILGANVRFTDGRDVPWIRDDTLVTRGSTRIGIIGISTQETPTNTLPANVRGLRFDEPAPVVDARARALRARGADVIVVVAHDGAFCSASGTEACAGEIIDLANALTEKVDAIVSGHTHSVIDFSVKGIPIVQARSSGQAIAVLDIPLSDGKPSGEGSGEVRQVVVSGTRPSASVDSLVKRATGRVGSVVNRRVARLGAPLARTGNQYALGNLIADAQRWAGKGDIAIMNNGGIRAGLRAGPVTYGSLFEVQPFANTLYRARMSGAQVKEYLERVVARDELREHVSGVTIEYNPELPKGQRIVSLRLPAGRTLSDAAMYNVIVNNFMATGGVNMRPPAGARLIPLGIVDLDALVDYMRTLRSPVTAPSEARIVITQ
ncbi:MAG: 5'-nucleotidase C-terminal domain-containing protein [Gemmatimonadaceae bacterium]|nr:5'-nucleotidase C-terminal domain-containing protein [Gemmatimonadaceae bacterium]